MKYFFVLGSNPTLSLAEISSVIGYDKKTAILTKEILVAETAKEIDAVEMIKRLGGTIKLGIIAANLENLDINGIVEKSSENFFIKKVEGKFPFGVSFYGEGKLKLNVLGMQLKKRLKEKGQSVRWVTSKDRNLSSVVVDTNKLLGKGVEIVLIKAEKQVLLGKTLAVQPFRELSKRDYGRPARDDHSGMLPPKLAQIMINLAVSSAPLRKKGYSPLLLDPFCGSGTIITEAALMGFDNLVGTDISEKAIDDTESNVSWVENSFGLKISDLKLKKLDARDLSDEIQDESVDYIVTEPYLGPQRGQIDFFRVKKELEILYSQSLLEFKKVLKPDGRIVMIWPVFTQHKNEKEKNRDLGFLDIKIDGFCRIDSVPGDFKRHEAIFLTHRNTILYGRPEQRVWREIVILENKKTV